MSNTPLKINQSYDYIVGMGILWFILRLVRIWGNKGHGMKHKSGKRKNSKRSFKPLEISFSWFKVVFLMER